jgi:hypothetical protein
MDHRDDCDEALRSKVRNHLSTTEDRRKQPDRRRSASFSIAGTAITRFFAAHAEAANAPAYAVLTQKPDIPRFFALISAKYTANNPITTRFSLFLCQMRKQAVSALSICFYSFFIVLSEMFSVPNQSLPHSRWVCFGI